MTGSRALRVVGLMLGVLLIGAGCAPSAETGDTTPPELAITNHRDGDTVDGSHGELLVLSGTSSDASGIASVVLTTPDGRTKPAAVDASGRWATTIGAPVSGPASFAVTATDKAGNFASSSISLVMVALPSGAGDVARPTTLRLDPALQAALTAVSSSELVFNGDVSERFAEFTTVVSGAVGTVAPDGLLVRIVSVTYDVALHRTTVTTTPAELLDAFAQFDYEAPATDQEPPSLQAPIGSSDATALSKCKDFVQGSTVKVRQSATVALGVGGGVGAVGADVATSVTVEAAFKAKIKIHVGVGWGGVDVSGSIGAGFMVCASGSISLSAAFSAQIPIFEKEIPAGTIFGLPVVVKPEFGVKVKDSVTVTTSSTAGFYAGVDVGYTLGESATIAYPHGADVGLGGGWQGTFSLGGYASLALGLGHDSNVEFGLFDASLGPKFTATTTPPRIQGCLAATGAFTPSLKIDLPFVGKYTVFQFRAELEKDFACTTLWSAADDLKVVGIAGAQLSTCALLKSGVVDCWGQQPFGDPPLPTRVDGVVGATSISAGNEYACAIVALGAVQCWKATSNNPQVVPGVADATSLAIGLSIQCAVLTNQTVSCWNGAPTGAPLTGVTNLAAGEVHACAVLISGLVKCWGENSYGELGDGTTTNSGSPVTVSGITGAVSVTAGDRHTCASLSSGAVRCWGYNDSGQLGNGSIVSSNLPVPVSGLSGVKQLAAGEVHTCALLTTGSVKCWGALSDHLLGDGTDTGSTVPVNVSNLNNVDSIAAGDVHTCAVLDGGAAMCWGDNGYGQIGDGTRNKARVPTAVAGIN